MLATIDLNDQLCARAIEVDDIITYDPLSVDLNTFKLLPSQVRPQQPLSIGHISPEFLRVSFQFGVVE